MQCSLVHIIPFDMGISFSNYEETRKYSKAKFLEALKKTLLNTDINTGDTDYLCAFNVSEKIECRLFAYGVGVFVVQNLTEAHNEKVFHTFAQNAACRTYYEKKAEQAEILFWDESPTAEVKAIFDIMDCIWSIKNGLKRVNIRPYSSNKSYKHHGLSYVLTIVITNSQHFTTVSMIDTYQCEHFTTTMEAA